MGKSARTRLLVYGPKLAVLKNVRALKLERGKSNEFDFWRTCLNTGITA
jgi:hypothetical protein